MLPMSTVSVVAATAGVGRATWFRSEDKTVPDSFSQIWSASV